MGLILLVEMPNFVLRGFVSVVTFVLQLQRIIPNGLFILSGDAKTPNLRGNYTNIT